MSQCTGTMALADLLHAFFPNYFHGSIAHKIGRFGHTIVEGNYLVSCRGKMWTAPKGSNLPVTAYPAAWCLCAHGTAWDRNQQVVTAAAVGHWVTLRRAPALPHSPLKCTSFYTLNTAGVKLCTYSPERWPRDCMRLLQYWWWQQFATKKPRLKMGTWADWLFCLALWV